MLSTYKAESEMRLAVAEVIHLLKEPLKSYE